MNDLELTLILLLAGIPFCIAQSLLWMWWNVWRHKKQEQPNDQ